MFLKILFAFFLSTVSKAQTADLSALAPLYPNCSLSCMVELIPKSPCLTDAGLNQTCACLDADLNSQISLCAAKSCTIKELLTTRNASSTACGQPVRDNSAASISVPLAFGSFAFAIFALRIFTRLFTLQKELYLDDYTMALTVLLAIPLTVFAPVLTHYGIGKDIWTLPFDDITNALKYFFLAELCYMVDLGLVKISMLCFFLRVFPVRRLQIAIYITMALCTGFSVAFFFATLFQCAPISYAWEQWNGEKKGRCNDFHLQGYLAAGINIFLDLVILLLPLKQIYDLDISKRKRFSVMLMFLVGVIVTIISSFRLKFAVPFRHTTNPTYDYVTLGYWSVLEVDVGIICACMPSIYQLLKVVWPKLVSRTNRGKSVPTEKTGRTESTSPFSPKTSVLRHKTYDEFESWEEEDPNSHPLSIRSGHEQA